MTSRIDELFSPDKLRGNWQNLPASTQAAPENTTNQAIMAQYLHLQKLVNEKFADADKLTVIFQNLSAEIEDSFGVEALTPVNGKQKQVIVNMLEELEELLSALDLLRWGT